MCNFCNLAIFPEISRKFSFQILGAIFLFLLGLIVAKIVGKIVREFLNKIHLNQLTTRLGWKEAFLRVKINLDLVRFFGEVARWMTLILFLMICFEVSGPSQFSQFLEKIVVDYFPDIIIASLIFIATLFLVDFTYRVFLVTTKKKGKETELSYSRFFGVGLRRMIWVLAALAILYQLRVVPNLILSIFIAILALIVLAVGISFGLGGKDIAKKVLEEWKEKLP